MEYSRKIEVTIVGCDDSPDVCSISCPHSYLGRYGTVCWCYLYNKHVDVLRVDQCMKDFPINEDDDAHIDVNLDNIDDETDEQSEKLLDEF